ncbi:TVP38/TMEM64 family protein [Bradyrhizobium cenepequi]
MPIDPQVVAELERFLPASALVDPERPADFDKLVEEFVPPEFDKPVAAHVVGFVVSLLVLALLAPIWTWTPLRKLIEPDIILATVTSVSDWRWTPLVIIAIYATSGLVLVPISALVVGTAIVLDAVSAFALALIGTVLNCVITYALGRALSRDAARWLAGSQLNAITRRLSKEGTLAVVVTRLLPVASFSKVNVAAGASHFPLRSFLLGTLVGMTPGIALTVAFIDRVKATIVDGDVAGYAGLVIVAGIALAFALVVWRSVGRARP